MSNPPVEIDGTGGATVQTSSTGRTLTFTLPGQSVSVTFDHLPTTAEVDDAVTRVTRPLLPAVQTRPVCIVFDGPPAFEGPRFVEADAGDVGEWEPYPNHEGWWQYVITALPSVVVKHEAPAAPVIEVDPAAVGQIVTAYPEPNPMPPMPGMGPDQRVSLPDDVIHVRGGW